MPLQPVQDRQTVNPDGSRVDPVIQGVLIRPAVTHEDERGSLCEILTATWPEFQGVPIVSVYQFSIRPGMAKGWHMHHHHTDRIFLSQGHVKVVLFDGRPDSPTFGMINEIHRSELHRTIMTIPPGVYHAHQNTGSTDALFVSMPTQAYDHASPDVHRLPLDTDQIPYRFTQKLGW